MANLRHEIGRPLIAGETPRRIMATATSPEWKRTRETCEPQKSPPHEVLQDMIGNALLTSRLALWVLMLSFRITIAADIYVATSGSDGNPGTASRPLASMQGARDLIRKQRADEPLAEPIRVHLSGGKYSVMAPIRFGPEDSGTAQCPITYSSAEGELAVLDGGRRIGGWRKHNDQLWVADVPEVNGRPWRFRQLYVDGKQAVRARESPTKGTCASRLARRERPKRFTTTPTVNPLSSHPVISVRIGST